MSLADLRQQLEALAEQIITVLDLMDGDADLEDDATLEEDIEQDIAPIVLDIERNPPRKVA